SNRSHSSERLAGGRTFVRTGDSGDYARNQHCREGFSSSAASAKGSAPAGSGLARNRSRRERGAAKAVGRWTTGFHHLPSLRNDRRTLVLSARSQERRARPSFGLLPLI